MKHILKAVVLSATLLSGVVSAEVVNNGTYLTDMETNLDWLRMDAASIAAMDENVRISNKWRIASSSQLEELMLNYTNDRPLVTGQADWYNDVNVNRSYLISLASTFGVNHTFSQQFSSSQGVYNQNRTGVFGKTQDTLVDGTIEEKYIGVATGIGVSWDRGTLGVYTGNYGVYINQSDDEVGDSINGLLKEDFGYFMYRYNEAALQQGLIINPFDVTAPLTLGMLSMAGLGFAASRRKSK